MAMAGVKLAVDGRMRSRRIRHGRDPYISLLFPSAFGSKHPSILSNLSTLSTKDKRKYLC